MNTQPFYRVSDDGTEILAGYGEQEIGVVQMTDCDADQISAMCDLASMAKSALSAANPETQDNIKPGEGDLIGEFVRYANELIGKLRDTLAKAKSRAGGQWHQELLDCLNEADGQAKRLLGALGTEE